MLDVGSAAVGAVQGVLAEINVDEETIRSIVSILESGIESLETPMHAVPQGAFGGSGWGQQLAHHTEIAHGHVRQAMLDLVAGLSTYKTSIETYAAQALQVDDNVVGATARLRTELDSASLCTARPDLQTNASCAPTKEP